MSAEKQDGYHTIPVTWNCVDCGFNTAPGMFGRERLRREIASKGSAQQSFDDNCELYYLKKSVWRATGMAEWDGCLCIGCVEKRLGRELTPDDFRRDHPFNRMPCTLRLLTRRSGLTLSEFANGGDDE